MGNYLIFVVDIDKLNFNFNCLKCGGCCGPHFVSESEKKLIRSYLASREIPERHYKTLLDKCPYYENDACIIYPVRPLVCRLMGISELMPCPKVSSSEVISKDEALALINNLLNQPKNKSL